MTPTTPSPAGSARDTVATTPAWLIVARREILAKLTDRTFLIGTAFSLALITGILVVQGIVAGGGDTFRVAVTTAAEPLAQAAQPTLTQLSAEDRIEVVRVADDAAAKAAVKDDRADAWLHAEGQGWVLTAKDEVDPTLQQAVQVALQGQVLADTAAKLDTSAAELTARSTLSTGVLDGDAKARDFARGAAYVLALLFYVSILGYGMTIALSVVEEKQSRIVEVVATKIPVRHLLAGKVLGNGALALGQMALFVAIALVGAAFTTWSGFVAALTPAVGWFVLFFLVGFLLLAALWAAAGSLATRPEDVQVTALPLTVLSVVMFFASLTLKGTWLTVASFVPPLSAIVMPMRLVDGSAAWWEPVVALALLLLTTVAAIRAGERLYRRALLQTQGRLSIRQAWSAPS